MSGWVGGRVGSGSYRWYKWQVERWLGEWQAETRRKGNRWPLRCFDQWWSSVRLSGGEDPSQTETGTCRILMSETGTFLISMCLRCGLYRRRVSGQISAFAEKGRIPWIDNFSLFADSPISPRVLSSFREPKAMAGSRIAMYRKMAVVVYFNHDLSLPHIPARQGGNKQM